MDYRAGKKQAIGALMGKVKGATGGRADPRVATRLLHARLGD